MLFPGFAISGFISDVSVGEITTSSLATLSAPKDGLLRNANREAVWSARQKCAAAHDNLLRQLTWRSLSCAVRAVELEQSG